jgi:hypothetical protein
MWQHAAATRAHLLWRIKPSIRLPRVATFIDGSWLAVLPAPGSRARYGTPVRVIDYWVHVTDRHGSVHSELFRLVTTLSDLLQHPQLPVLRPGCLLNAASTPSTPTKLHGGQTWLPQASRTVTGKQADQSTRKPLRQRQMADRQRGGKRMSSIPISEMDPEFGATTIALTYPNSI